MQSVQTKERITSTYSQQSMNKSPRPNTSETVSWEGKFYKETNSSSSSAIQKLILLIQKFPACKWGTFNSTTNWAHLTKQQIGHIKWTISCAGSGWAMSIISAPQGTKVYESYTQAQRPNYSQSHSRRKFVQITEQKYDLSLIFVVLLILWFLMPFINFYLLEI